MFTVRRFHEKQAISRERHRVPIRPLRRGEGEGERGKSSSLFSYKILVLGIVNTIEMPEIPPKLPVVARQLLEHRQLVVIQGVTLYVIN